MKIFKYAGIVFAVIVFFIAALGAYKFNILEDDIYLSGSAVTESDIVGQWVISVPGREGKHQGFELFLNGQARPIKMAIPKYSNWYINNGNLILTSKNTSNQSTASETHVFRINTVGKTQMDLANSKGAIKRYKRITTTNLSDHTNFQLACRELGSQSTALKIGGWNVDAGDIQRISWKSNSAGFSGLLIVFSSSGANKLEQQTVLHLNKALVFTVDGQIIGNAVVREPITTGRLMIALSLTENELKIMAKELAGTCQ